jgi:hypothetical protein
MFPDWIACFGVPATKLRMSFVAVCWCSFVTVKLCVGVDVATSGKASAVRATCVRIGGILLLLFGYPRRCALDVDGMNGLGAKVCD